MKKFISVVLTLAILVCAMPMALAADCAWTSNGIEYSGRKVKSIYGTSVAFCGVLTRGVKNVVMPEECSVIDGAVSKVSSIDIRAFDQNNTIESFTFNSFCTDVGDYAFRGTSKLKTVNFSKATALRSLAMGVFQDSGLESIELGFAVNSIGKDCFYGCKNLKTFKAGFSLTTIGENALNNCPSLETVYLSNSVTKIAPKSIGYTNSGEKNENLTIVAPNGSVAIKYAVDNGFKYKYDISGAFTNDIKDRKYTGKEIKPAVTVKQAGNTLKNGVDYTITYSKNVKPGNATVTIKGMGNYTGTLTTTFFIKPIVKKVTGVKTSVKKKKMTVKWKKLKDISGYQIVYSTKKSFKGKKTVTASKKVTYKKINKTLKKGKYYVKVRAYKTISGKKTYGDYSKVVTRKVK